MKSLESQSVKWFQINNVVPIVITFMTLAITYGALLTRISVLETKMDIVIEQQKQVLAKFHDVETRYGELALKIQRIETIIEK